MYLERAHPAFLTTLVVLVVLKLHNKSGIIIPKIATFNPNGAGLLDVA